MASSLSTWGCIPSVSMDSLKISLSWSSFTEGKHEFFQIFPFAWEARDLWMSTLSVKTEAKLSTSTFLHSLGCPVPHPIQQQNNIFLAFLLLLMHAQQLFFSLFTSLTRFNSQCTLAMLTPFLHTHCLYFPASSALVSTSCMPPFVLQFCLEGIVQPYGSPTIFALVHSKRDHIWTCRRWFLKILQFPWTPLLSGPLTGPHCMGNS